MEDIEEGRQKRGPRPTRTLMYPSAPTAQDGDFELWGPFVEKAPPNQAKRLQPWNIPTETGVESTEVGRALHLIGPGCASVYFRLLSATLKAIGVS